MIAELVIATGNAGKVREIRRVLDGLGLTLLSLADLDPVPEPEETGQTFAENARAKALAYASALGRMVVAEDSGLEIDDLDGVPGVYSARFGLPGAPSYPQKFELLYRMLRERSGRVDSDARFVCALALAAPAGPEGAAASLPRIVFEATGTVEGRIIEPPRGAGGFGYDPIFYYPPFGQTLAEVPAGRKEEVSHRGKAFRKLRKYLEPSLRREP
ncbi:MAG TPA: RdgB/HAM1 family non-canonical purine NTP pyrophosphatase [Vicinamibacterales bacterium]|nr:RdgB/HAM1 family non-canonical purine NTP pyrophosphatase [Acidobacteriota bacterium]HOC16832.1 RdgB/HAM1 family non-canonical purine NTP pyrophosphatase [Vicinamibacterales bacterium]